MNKLKYIILSLLVFLVFNCRSSRTISGGEANFKLSTKQLLKENSKLTPVFNTMQSKLKITYNQDGNEQSYTVNFRAKKDEMLWISATFSVVKALVTPEKVSFYNKLDNTYFDGDYALISDFLGTDLQFENLQKLLLGEAIFDIKPKEFKKKAHPNSYMLIPKQSNAIFELLYLINPTYFKLDTQQVSQTLGQNVLKIHYRSYQKVEGLALPENMGITATNANEQMALNLNIKSVSLDQPLRFPFNIPKGFKAIELK